MRARSVRCPRGETNLTRRYAVFRNEQWEVTDFGLVSRRPGAPYRYQIDAEQLLQFERRLYGWPLYVIQKPWVKPDQFLEAFKAAINAHEGRYPGKVNLALLQTSFDVALDIAEHRRLTGQAKDTAFSTGSCSPANPSGKVADLFVSAR